MAEIVVLTVPYASQLEMVRALKSALQGKILVDVTAPLVPPKVSQVQLPATYSCVVAVQNELGDDVRVVSAFQNVPAHKLKDLEYKISATCWCAATTSRRARLQSAWRTMQVCVESMPVR